MNTILLTADLPTWPYLYGNQLAVQMYACTSQNTDKEFLGSTEIQTHMVHCFGRKAFECHSVVGLQCASVFENESLRTLQFAYKMNDRNIVLGYFSVWINWLCIRQKSGQKSENLDTGCLDTDRSTLGGGAHL